MFGKALGNLVGAGKKIVDETEQIDDRFYAEVIDEISSGHKDKALVGKAIAQSDGNEAKFDSIYMKLRARALQDAFVEKQEQPEIEDKQKTSIKAKHSQGYFHHLFENEIKNKGYNIPLFGGANDFKKDGKKYRGEIDFETMCYVIIDKRGEVMNMFKIEPN